MPCHLWMKNPSLDFIQALEFYREVFYSIKDFGFFIFGLGLCDVVNLKHLRTAENIDSFSLQFFSKIFYIYPTTSLSEEAEITIGTTVTGEWLPCLYLDPWAAPSSFPPCPFEEGEGERGWEFWQPVKADPAHAQSPDLTITAGWQLWWWTISMSQSWIENSKANLLHYYHCLPLAVLTYFWRQELICYWKGNKK